MSIKLRITFLICVGVVLYLKSFYSLIIIILFSFQNIYFVEYLFDIYAPRTDYLSIKINEVDVSNSRSLDIWREYSRISAFKRVYLMHMKRKIRFIDFVRVSIIIFLGIPYRFLKLSRYFIMSDRGFRDSLEILYLLEFGRVKTMKIEVLNKKVYLNCYTMSKLCREIIIANPNMQKEELLLIVSNLRKRAIFYSKYEEKTVELLYMRSEKIFSIYHPSLHKYDVLIHGTSNINFPKNSDQKIDIPMPSLIKRGAPNPGTVLTQNVNKVEILEKKRGIMIAEVEINEILYNNDMPLSKENSDYLIEKSSDLMEVSGVNKRNSFIRSLNNNNFNFVLENTSDSEVLSIMDEVIKEKLI